MTSLHRKQRLKQHSYSQRWSLPNIKNAEEKCISLDLLHNNPITLEHLVFCTSWQGTFHQLSPRKNISVEFFGEEVKFIADLP